MNNSTSWLWSRLTLTAGVLSCTSAFATPSVPSQPNSGLHIGKAALDQIGALALQKLPSHIEAPPFDKDVLDICPQGPVALHVRQAYFDLVPASLSFTPADGSLGISALLDLSGFAQVTMEHAYGCLGDAQCDVAFSATQLAPQAQLGLSMSNGNVAAEIGASSVTASLHVELHNCVLDGIPQSWVDGVSNKLLEMSQGLINDQLRTIVPPMIVQQVTSMSSQSGELSGYGLAATLTDLKMTATGIDAYAAVGVAYDGTAAACIPAGAAAPAPRDPTPAAIALALPAKPSSSIVVGVGTQLVSSAIAAAWRSGIMCIDDLSLAGLGFDPSHLASLVPGLPDGLGLKFSFAMDAPPTVETDANGALRMRVMGATLNITLTVPNQAPSTAMVSTDFTVVITPAVDPTSGTIFATLGDMSMERMEMQADAANTTYTLDPERMTVMIRDVVLPLAASKLRGMPLSPASFNVAGFYSWLNDMSAHDAALYAGIEAYMPGPAVDDTQPPETLMQKQPGPLVRPGMARYQVSGSDDQTPSQLLRYEWQLDGGAVAAASYSRIIQVPVMTAGNHTFRVRAVDLTGKGSATWKSHNFTLDNVPPTLTVLEQPSVSARVSVATIRFSGSDDISAPNLLSYAYRLSSKAPGGETQFVRNVEPTSLDGGMADIEIGDLSSGTVYEATLMLYDEAGNVTSKRIAFAAAPTGCSVSGTPSSSACSLILLAGLLLIVNRRRILAR